MRRKLLALVVLALAASVSGSTTARGGAPPVAAGPRAASAAPANLAVGVESHGACRSPTSITTARLDLALVTSSAAPTGRRAAIEIRSGRWRRRLRDAGVLRATSAGGGRRGDRPTSTRTATWTSRSPRRRLPNARGDGQGCARRRSRPFRIARRALAVPDRVPPQWRRRRDRRRSSRPAWCPGSMDVSEPTEPRGASSACAPGRRQRRVRRRDAVLHPERPLHRRGRLRQRRPAGRCCRREWAAGRQQRFG